jgi:hypothetical protein
MPNFVLEQKQDGEWVNVGQGEFADFETANQEVKSIMNVYGIPSDEIRFRRIDKIDVSQLEKCKCGGLLTYSGENYICVQCEESIHESQWEDHA